MAVLIVTKCLPHFISSFPFTVYELLAELITITLCVRESVEWKGRRQLHNVSTLLPLQCVEQRNYELVVPDTDNHGESRH